jgi:hypothetical protein
MISLDRVYSRFDHILLLPSPEREKGKLETLTPSLAQHTRRRRSGESTSTVKAFDTILEGRGSGSLQII